MTEETASPQPVAGKSAPAGVSPPISDLVRAMQEELRLLAAELVDRDRMLLHVAPAELIQAALFRLLLPQPLNKSVRDKLFSDCAPLLRSALEDALSRKTPRPSLSLLIGAAPGSPEADRIDFTQIHTALNGLAQADPQLSRLIEMRYFAGLTLEDITTLEERPLHVLEQSWRLARAWLHDALKSSDNG